MKMYCKCVWERLNRRTQKQRQRARRSAEDTGEMIIDGEECSVEIATIDDEEESDSGDMASNDEDNEFDVEG